MSAHLAVQEDAVLRLEADGPAVRRHRQALPVAAEARCQIVDLGRSPRGVQQSARPHHHIGRALAAHGDLAAFRHMAVAQAVRAYGVEAPPRNVDDALLAQPQGGCRIVDDLLRLII
ncbi:hypothetical protein D3C73_975390 [compost metagenome]